mgnify:CR=1 FL=1|tara:strand:+ start:662 stop:1801 length:1140 start_codon:yes stop_codon:yes gene_type:complete
MAKHNDLRVVLCAPGFPVSADDADKPFLLDHALALVNAGLEVTVVCPMVNGARPRQSIGKIEVIRVAYAPRRWQTLASTGSMYQEARGVKALLVLPMLFCLTVAMIRQLRKRNTVAYGHWWVPGGCVAVLAGLLTRRPRVVHLHGSDAAITTTKILRMGAWVVIRLADARLAVSSDLAEWGERSSSRKVQVLPMPLDIERLPSSTPAPENGLFLGVGRLVPEKGFDLLIEAAALVEPQQRPEITIVGVGPERSRLDALARRLKVELHLPGAVSPKDIGDWYRRASVVVVPSRREGFGLVAAEAAASARAIVGTKVGALPQIIEDGVSGLLVEPENVDALAEALTSINPAWGSRGPAKVSELGMESHGRQVRRLCEDLLS